MDEKRDTRHGRKFHRSRWLFALPFNLAFLVVAALAINCQVDRFYGKPIITPQFGIQSASVQVVDSMSFRPSNFFSPSNFYAAGWNVTLFAANPSGNHALYYTDMEATVYMGKNPFPVATIPGFYQLESQQHFLNLTFDELPIKIEDFSSRFCWDFYFQLSGNITQHRKHGIEYNWGARSLTVSCKLGADFSQTDGVLEASSGVCVVSVAEPRLENRVVFFTLTSLILVVIKICNAFDKWALHGNEWDWSEAFVLQV